MSNGYEELLRSVRSKGAFPIAFTMTKRDTKDLMKKRPFSMLQPIREDG
jgi:uncharacterized protein (DUF1015 family)